MRNYQPKKNNPYRLPQTAYMRALYLVRDYDRLQKELQEIPYRSPLREGPPHSGIAKPTEQAALYMETLDRQCRSVEKALSLIPAEYRMGIVQSILKQAIYPQDAHSNTYSLWRCRFLWQVAKNEGII